jgi:hypothetical protein
VPTFLYSTIAKSGSVVGVELLRVAPKSGSVVGVELTRATAKSVSVGVELVHTAFDWGCLEHIGGSFNMGNDLVFDVAGAD